MRRPTPFLAAAALLAAACGESNPTTPGTNPAVPAKPLFDDVSNSVDLTIDAAAESMTLTAGGTNGITTLYISPTGGDGKPGCNLTGSTSLTLSISSSNPSVATVSPSSVTFTSCGDVKTLTVTPVAASVTPATISVSQTANTTGASFNLAPATFTVTVNPANTAPSVSVVGVTSGASYPKGSVPPATCQVTDAEDGNKSIAATLSAITGPNAADGIGSQTASCSYTDAGGLSASASATYSIVDASAPLISYLLSPSAPDGANGWFRSNVSLAWTVTGTSLSKTGCADQSITADQAAIVYSCTASNSAGSTGPVTVEIKRDATAPTVAYSSPTTAANANGWYNADVVATFTATDNLSGFGAPASLTKAGTSTTSGEGAAVTVGSPAFADNAGNPAPAGTATSEAFRIDKTKPTASASATPSANANGWNNSTVTVSFSGSDALSGVASCTPDVVLTAETSSSGQVVSGTCTDRADNQSGAAAVTVRIDKTAPTISGAATTSPNANGWYKGDVTIAWTCSDALSGIDGSCPANSTISGEGSNLGAGPVSVSDKAANSTSASVSGIKIDRTAPVLSLVGGPASGGSYYFGSVPAAPTCSATDALSGLAGLCTVSGYDATVGPHTVQATVADNAGNSSTVSVSYTVLAWTLGGFFQPVDMGGVFNTVKAGATVPMKFTILAGSTPKTSTADVKSFAVKEIVCSSSAPVDDIEVVTTGGTVLRYDATAQQFVQNWQTPSTPGKCYQVTLTTLDGSSLSALFKLK